MSMYPAPSVSQGLYESSATRKMPLGYRHAHFTDQGIVEAVYVSNGNAASVAAGMVQGHGLVYGAVDTAVLANTGAIDPRVAGINCASFPIGGFGWVAYRGPVTVMSLAASATSGAFNNVIYTAATNGLLGTVATTIGTAGNADFNLYLGIGHGATTNVASSGGGGAIINLFWRG